MKHSLRQSLNEIESVQHNRDSSELPTDLAAKCKALRSKALQDYTVEDLRLSIGQGIGLTWLVPLALTQLQHDIVAEGDYYPGDLLSSVIRLPDSYWQQHRANLKSFLQLLHAQLPTSSPAGMPASTFREVQRRVDSLTVLLA
jgi:hypothetical protein